MIYCCADDFGMSEESCGRIRECIKYGALNKVSVFPNTAIQDIDLPKVTLSVHLNLVEGKPVSNPEELPLLTDDRGYFKHSFTGLLLLSLSSCKDDLKKQIYSEIKNQIKRCKAMGMKCEAIDSHQHTHMIPLIFSELLKACGEEGIEYIRIPSEPLLPYVLSPSLYLSYRPINIIKQWLLKIFALINKKGLKKSGIKTALFMGVLFSGRMDKKRVMKVLPYYLKLAEKKNTDIELLFHPGYANRGENVMDKEKKGFNKFYFSQGRRIEFEALKEIKLQN